MSEEGGEHEEAFSTDGLDVCGVIKLFEGALASNEIGDGDKVEGRGKVFSEWLVGVDYLAIQVHFSGLWPLVRDLMGHWRPGVRNLGCLSLLKLMKDAAPVQVQVVAGEVRSILRHIIQVGNDDGLSIVLKCVVATFNLIWKDLYGREFHEFMTDVLSTWGRTSVSVATGFEFCNMMVQCLPMMGRAAPRWATLILTTISGRIPQLKGKQHLRAVVAVIRALCDVLGSLVRASEKQLREALALVREREVADVLPACAEIELLLDQAPNLPTIVRVFGGG